MAVRLTHCSVLVLVVVAICSSDAFVQHVEAQDPVSEIGESQEEYGKSLLRAAFANMRSLDNFDVSFVRERVERNRDNALVEQVARVRQVIDRGSGKYFFASLIESRMLEEAFEKTPSHPALRAVHIDVGKRESWLLTGISPAQRAKVSLDSPNARFELSALSGSREPDLRCIGFFTFPTGFYKANDYVDLIEEFLSYPRDRWSVTSVNDKLFDVAIDRPMELEGYSTRFWYRFDAERLVPIEIRTFDGYRGKYTPTVFERIDWNTYNGQLLPVRLVGEEHAGEALPSTYEVKLKWHVVNDEKRLPDVSASTLVDAKVVLEMINRSDDANEGAADK